MAKIQIKSLSEAPLVKLPPDFFGTTQTQAFFDKGAYTIEVYHHRLQRDAMENFIEMVQALGDTGEFRAAGVGPVSRQRIIMLLGGLQELTAITVEEGGRMSDVTEEAVHASIALLAPRVQPD